MGCGSCGQGGVVNAVQGAIKLAKSELGIGVIDEQQIMQRRGLCEACFEWDHGRCRKCGCFTWAKTRLTHEKCPLGKWGAAT